MLTFTFASYIILKMVARKILRKGVHEMNMLWSNVFQQNNPGTYTGHFVVSKKQNNAYWTYTKQLQKKTNNTENHGTDVRNSIHGLSHNPHERVSWIGERHRRRERIRCWCRNRQREFPERAYPKNGCARFMFSDNSMVECPAVTREVKGSNPFPRATWGYSAIGSAPVSKTVGWRFETFYPCQKHSCEKQRKEEGKYEWLRSLL